MFRDQLLLEGANAIFCHNFTRFRPSTQEERERESQSYEFSATYYYLGRIEEAS